MNTHDTLNELAAGAVIFHLVEFTAHVGMLGIVWWVFLKLQKVDFVPKQGD